MEKLEPLCNADGNVAAAPENSLVFSQKVRVTYDPAILLLSIYPKELI